MDFQRLKIRHNEPFVDWLAFSVPDNPISNRFINSTFGERREREKGYLGYPCSADLGKGGLIAYDPNDKKKKLHIVLSSKSLHSLSVEPFDLIDSVIFYGGNFTRIDIAKDDYAGLLDVEKIWNLMFPKKCLTSRFRRFSRIQSVTKAKKREFFHDEEGNVHLVNEPDHTKKLSIAELPELEKGDTIYFGSRQSDTFCRIYDKGAQTKTDYHWTRLEFEFKKEKAQALAKTIRERNIASLYYYYIDFKDDSSKRIDRCETLSWWNEFLRTVDKASLQMPPNEIGLEEVLAWFESQCSGALNLILDTYGLNRIKEIAQEGRKRYENNDKYQKLKLDYRNLRCAKAL